MNNLKLDLSFYDTEEKLMQREQSLIFIKKNKKRIKELYKILQELEHEFEW